MPDRRRFLQRVASLPVLGAVMPEAVSAEASSHDYFRELGIRTFINAAGTYTTLTASLMPPGVMEAIQYASRSYVNLIELQDKVGVRIASLLGVEAAMVTSGVASFSTKRASCSIQSMAPDSLTCGWLR